jgi:phenylalanyl-tRNA synthetase alpha chain
MSAPNNPYDPVGVSSLEAEAIDAMVAAALTALAEVSDLDDLKSVRLAHAGDRSPLALANREIGALPPAAKAEAGKRMGQARQVVREALEARLVELEQQRDARVLVEEAVDVTLPTRRAGLGARHPLTTLMERMSEVFIAMGYEVAEGPEAEAEWFNFDALNVPPDHPARTMQDTFFVGSELSGVVLRTQTSPIQLRAMLERELPIYVVAPGRVFRTDELDATHTPVFHQACRSVFARPTSPSPSRVPSWTFSASCAEERLSATPMRRAGLAQAKVGSNGAAAGWSTLASFAPRVSTLTAIPALPSAWAWSAP